MGFLAREENAFLVVHISIPIYLLDRNEREGDLSGIPLGVVDVAGLVADCLQLVHIRIGHETVKVVLHSAPIGRKMIGQDHIKLDA